MKGDSANKPESTSKNVPTQPQQNDNSQFEIEWGSLKIRGPQRFILTLVVGLLCGGLLFYLAVFQIKKPPIVYKMLVEEPFFQTQTAAPSVTPQIVEVTREVTRIVPTVYVTKETVLVPTTKVIRETVVVTKTVIVTPAPIPPPDLVVARMKDSFEEMGTYLQSGDISALSDMWANKEAINKPIWDYFYNIFYKFKSIDWIIKDYKVTDNHSATYSLTVDSVLHLVDAEYSCGGKKISNKLDIPYKITMTIDIKDPSLGTVSIQSWSLEYINLPYNLCKVQ